MELFIGIDWADEDHDVYITNEIGQNLDCFAIDDSLLGLQKFLNRVKKHDVHNDSVHIAIETPHGLMVNAIVRQGYKVYPINPKAVKNERKTYRTSEARDDDFDAYVLAHMLRMRVLRQSQKNKSPDNIKDAEVAKKQRTRRKID